MNLKIKLISDLNALSYRGRLDHFNKINNIFDYITEFGYAKRTLALATLKNSESVFINMYGEFSTDGIEDSDVYRFDVEERTAYVNQIIDPELNIFTFHVVFEFKQFANGFFAIAESKNLDMVYVDVHGNIIGEDKLISFENAPAVLKSFISELESLEKILEYSSEYPFVSIRAIDLQNIINKYKL